MNIDICKRCCGAKKFVVCAFSKWSRFSKTNEPEFKGVCLHDCIEVFNGANELVCTAMFRPSETLLDSFDFGGAWKREDSDGFEILHFNTDDIGESCLNGKEIYSINWISGIKTDATTCPYKMEHDVYDWSNPAKISDEEKS